MVKKEAASTKGEYKRFRVLLRQGIGTRSQKAFAAETGISYEHLNRMLNNREINRPTRKTLESLAGKMETVALDDLLKACGYEAIDIHNKAEEVEEGLKNAMDELVKKDGIQIWSSLKEVLDVAKLLHLEESGDFICAKEEMLNEGLRNINCSEGRRIYNGAERYCKVTFSWGIAKEYDCRTYLILFFAPTCGGKVVITDYAMDAETLHTFCAIPEAVYRKAVSTGKTDACTDIYEPKKNPRGTRLRERLYASLFAVDGRYSTTVVGYGFYWPETPEGFKDFLIKHSSAFCTTKEKSSLCRRAISADADPDDVFAGYATDDDIGAGAGTVAAEILREETGMGFCYFGPDEHLGGKSEDACIMLEAESGTEEWMPQDLLHTIYEAARELRIPEFGVCYHTMTMPKTVMQRYKTDEFHIEYAAKKN